MSANLDRHNYPRSWMQNQLFFSKALVNNRRVVSMRILIALVLACTLTACSTLSSRMNSWIGTPITEYIDRVGVPTSTLKVGDKTYYEWYSHSSTPYMGYNAFTKTYQSYSINHSCRITMITDTTDIIRSWSADC